MTDKNIPAPQPEQNLSASDAKPSMKECFGISFGWFMEDLIGDYDQRLKCYECADFEKCQQMVMIRNLTQLRYEVRRSTQTISRAIGGSHSTFPFG